MHPRHLLPLLALLGCTAPTAEEEVSATAQTARTCDRTARPFGGGDGSALSPFLLCAPAHLDHLGDAPTTAFYRLASDLDLRDTAVRGITRFVGVLDGDGRTIAGLVADGTATQGAWIAEQRGHVRNLRITGAKIVGRALLAERNFGVIEASTFEGEVSTSGTASAGGIVAENLGLISDVRVTATVAGISAVGGVVGRNTALGRVIHAFFDGAVTGGSLFVGGIAGTNEGLLRDVHAKGRVAMGPAVGRGAGGIAGWLSGTVEIASADVSVHAENSAGGLVGRARGGTLSRAYARGSARANENAGGIVGLVEFGATFEDAYALVDVTVDHSGARAFGDKCVRCFFDGKVAGAYQRVRSLPDGQPGSTDAVLDRATSFPDFGPSWDLSRLAVDRRPRLIWEATPPGATKVDAVPVQISIFQPVRPPKTIVFVDQATGQQRHGAFGRAAGSPWIHAVVYLPPGDHAYSVTKGAGGSWCSISTIAAGRATTSRTIRVGGAPIVDQSTYVSCPPYSGDDWPDHPGAGQLLRAPARGLVLFADDGESDAIGWELIGLFRRTRGTPCLSPSAASGLGAFHYGDPNGCHYDHRPSTGSAGSVGIGWMTSPPIAGVSEGAKLVFQSYRDVGGRDATTVVIFPEGQGSRVGDQTFQKTVWSRTGPQPSDGRWERVEIPLPPAWFYGRPLQIRFAVETRDAFEHRGKRGWAIDDVTIVR
jgi:hypothetical protein